MEPSLPVRLSNQIFTIIFNMMSLHVQEMHNASWELSQCDGHLKCDHTIIIGQQEDAKELSHHTQIYTDNHWLKFLAVTCLLRQDGWLGK